MDLLRIPHQIAQWETATEQLARTIDWKIE
jgi:hypothetical protein